MSECIIWDGPHKDNGGGQIYGILHHADRDRHGTRYAHRDAYIVANGQPPDKYHIHHACGETLCVNPEHLIALSPTDHARIHHANKPTCKAGHPWSSETLSFQAGRRLCRLCRNRRMNEWSAVHRDAAYWRAYRKRKAEEYGFETFADYRRWRKGVPKSELVGNRRLLRGRDEKGRFV